MCDLRLVLWANFLLQPSNGQTYGLSPVWIRTCVRRLKSRENLLPHPSKVHWKRKNYDFLIIRKQLIIVKESVTHWKQIIKINSVVTYSNRSFHTQNQEQVLQKKVWMRRTSKQNKKNAFYSFHSNSCTSLYLSKWTFISYISWLPETVFLLCAPADVF